MSMQICMSTVLTPYLLPNLSIPLTKNTNLTSLPAFSLNVPVFTALPDTWCMNGSPFSLRRREVQQSQPGLNGLGKPQIRRYRSWTSFSASCSLASYSPSDCLSTGNRQRQG